MPGGTQPALFIVAHDPVTQAMISRSWMCMEDATRSGLPFMPKIPKPFEPKTLMRLSHGWPGPTRIGAAARG